MQLKKSSLFYKFLTLFDQSVFLDYDEENGELTESTNTCDVFSTFLLNSLLCFFVAVAGIAVICGVGLTLGWIAAMISTASFIFAGPLEFIVSLVVIGSIVLWVFDKFKDKVTVTESETAHMIKSVIKSKLEKVCVRIDIK